MESIGEAAASTARGAEPAPAPDDRRAENALYAALRAVERRVRLQRALDAAVMFAWPALALSAVALGAIKIGRGDAAHAHALLVLACVVPGIGLAYGALREVPQLFVARAIDRALLTPDLVGSACAFLRLPEVSRTPFMRACIDQAVRESARVDPSQAFALRRPRALYALAGAALALALLSRLSLPVAAVPVVKAVPKPRLLEQEDVRLFAEDVRALRLDTRSDADVREAARELNALLEALAGQQLDRADALRELRGLEQRLQNAELGRDAEALREALRELGRSLAKDSPLAEPLAAALTEADAEKARAELERLAARVAQEPLRSDARSRLERALRRASHSAQADAKERAKERAEEARAEVERLLQRKRDGAAQGEREQRLLRDKQRELEKLERDAEQQARSERQLEQLQRELSSSAQSLGAGDSREAAQHLQQGAQSLDRAQRSQLSQQQREQLRERVQQLREQISKQQKAQQAGAQTARDGGKGQASQGQVQRLDLEHFGKAARGAVAEGSQGQGGGNEPGKPAGMALMPGRGEPNGAQLGLPEGSGEQPGSQLTQRDGEQPGGSQAGQGAQPPGRQAPTQLSSSRVDTRVEGQAARGPSRSDVIRQAGQRGFIAREYQQVHGEYERHAEAVVERDHVPPGYRFYVRRYFQLIRPREETR